MKKLLANYSLGGVGDLGAIPTHLVIKSIPKIAPWGVPQPQDSTPDLFSGILFAGAPMKPQCLQS